MYSKLLYRQKALIAPAPDTLTELAQFIFFQVIFITFKLRTLTFHFLSCLLFCPYHFNVFSSGRVIRVSEFSASFCCYHKHTLQNQKCLDLDQQTSLVMINRFSQESRSPDKSTATGNAQGQGEKLSVSQDQYWVCSKQGQTCPSNCWGGIQ